MSIDNIVNDTSNFWGVTMLERMDIWNVPGVSIALVRDGQVESYSYGRKNRYRKEAVTRSTMFQAASISKPIFATAVMRLVEEGKLDLDSNVSHYLKDYRIPTFDGKEHDVTLRRILSHTAGLNIHGFPGYQHKQKLPTVNEILEGKRPANTDLLFLFQEPGKDYSYSGGGYVLAQKIVCEVLNQDFEEIMQELILQPFDMKNSTYLQPLSKDREWDMACGINSHDVQIDKGYCIMPELAAAGLWTTATDLATYGVEMMKALKGESNLLKNETVEMMIHPVLPFMGLSLFLGERNGMKYFEHRGSNIGFHSGMSFYPESGNGVAVMVNADRGEQLVTMLLDGIAKSF